MLDQRAHWHLRSLAAEALALARQATLLHRDVLPVVPRTERGDVVVLLHGFLATAGVLRPLGAAIERAASARTASFTHTPGVGIETIARRLAELVRSIPSPEIRIHLVGHSIGGLAARWFVTELGGDARVAGTVSIASPFEGAPRARLFPGHLARDIEPGSALLARLRGAESTVPHLSIAGGHDRVVPSGALLSYGERLFVERAGHNELIYDHETVSAVVARIAKLGVGRSTGPRDSTQ
jgi:pimeloyl-ACP methyl ester carboxylesterase